MKFYHPEALEDYETLRDRTLEVLNFATDHLNVITETADWLTREEFAVAVDRLRSRQIRVRLILASLGPEDDSYRPVQEKKWSDLAASFPSGCLDVRILPWEEHEIHMTVSHDGRGIYFLRHHKAASFVPWHISDRRDAQLVLHEFDRFWSLAVPWDTTTTSVDQSKAS
jgi:hypothetical protein